MQKKEIYQIIFLVISFLGLVFTGCTLFYIDVNEGYRLNVDASNTTVAFILEIIDLIFLFIFLILFIYSLVMILINYIKELKNK
ncbi:MAG: hypothetical protein IAC58_04995 [Firmicutes bacterium]|uniref:Uncharacterized protein n=1 Tax=Candidatus Onthovivens merdipullorum TaxID=2840889 RepID=A0A9D9GXH5_9BACL|nr:hypothetical protein [Candidatus Onthovivens merdipullorum]